NFVVDDLSNWYIRLNRRRFWKGEQGDDKTAAFQTLYHCLQVVAQLSAPFAPFFSDRLHRDLTGRSVHLTDWPQQGATDVDLVRSMRRAQEIVSVVLGLRKQERIRVRQPLTKVQITLPDNSDTWRSYRTGVETKRDIILSECNVKDIVFLNPQESQLTKRIKPDFKKLGARMGKLMKAVAAAVSALPQERISELESNGNLRLPVEGREVEILRDDVEITLEPREGFVGVSDNGAVIELDITLTDELVQEGIARELVSRIQALRKDSGLEVTDRIELGI